MQFGVLGPLLVEDASGHVTLASAKQRALLAILLLETPHDLVPTERLIESRILSQDRDLEPRELRPRFKPQVLDEKLARLTEDRERIRLAAGSVEREHQQPVHPLPVRMTRDQGLELRH